MIGSGLKIAMGKNAAVVINKAASRVFIVVYLSVG